MDAGLRMCSNSLGLAGAEGDFRAARDAETRAEREGFGAFLFYPWMMDDG